MLGIVAVTTGVIGLAGPASASELGRGSSADSPPDATGIRARSNDLARELKGSEAASGDGSSQRVPALMYHRITCADSDTRLPHLWVCPGRLDKTLRLLKEHGWDTMTAERVASLLKSGGRIPAKTFVIILDDGSRDGYDNALPILEKYGFEATFGVVVGKVSVKRWHMTWRELRELQERGHEIANHSMTHANLGATNAAFWWEIERSAQVLAEHLGSRPKTFVYPYGSHNVEAVAQVKESGFRLAYTTVYGCVHSWSDRLREERIRINGWDSPRDVLDKVRPCD